MPRSSIEHILQDIETLSDEDLLTIEWRLAARLGQEWEREAALARAESQRRGIDQASIDLAIESTRYGR